MIDAKTARKESDFYYHQLLNTNIASVKKEAEQAIIDTIKLGYSNCRVNCGKDPEVVKNIRTYFENLGYTIKQGVFMIEYFIIICW